MHFIDAMFELFIGRKFNFVIEHCKDAFWLGLPLKKRGLILNKKQPSFVYFFKASQSLHSEPKLAKIDGTLAWIQIRLDSNELLSVG